MKFAIAPSIRSNAIFMAKKLIIEMVVTIEMASIQMMVHSTSQ